MLSFEEWCRTQFGIRKMWEGKIVKKFFFSIQINPILDDPQFQAKVAGLMGPLVVRNGIPGYVLSQNAKDTINLKLASSNMRLRGGTDDETPAPFYAFIEPEKQNEFLSQFAAYAPFPANEPLSGRKSIYIPATALDALYQQYFEENKSNESRASLTSRLAALKLIRQRLYQDNLVSSLEMAHRLSLDNHNVGVHALTFLSACTTYALSLQIFVELHKPVLSKKHSILLLYLIDLLASDNPCSSRQSLKQDAAFVDVLLLKVGSSAYKSDNSRRLISELPNGADIENIIDENAHLLLYGEASTGKGRFLPDGAMQSETNEIILQTGGMISHSAMARIIKIGMLQNGQQAKAGQIPAYFNYYKVETNLGTGAHELDPQFNTCTGTYVTQLKPTLISSDGKVQYINVDPLASPVIYQWCMEKTLIELIKTERHLSFYRSPYSGSAGESISPKNSTEAGEWCRLHAYLDILNGTPVRHPITFDSHFSNTALRCKVQNQKNYVQEGGSCSIFSIKQLITSIVGYDLASLHSHFLQTHNGENHLQDVENEIDLIEQQLEDLKTRIWSEQVRANYFGATFFFTSSEDMDEEEILALNINGGIK